MKNKAFIIGGIIAGVLIIGGIIGWRLLSGTSEGGALDGMEPVAFEEVSEDDAISEKEYMALLNEAFSYEDTLEYSDRKITGREAVEKGVDRLGPAYREFLLDGKEDTPETRFELLQKKGVLSKKYDEAYMNKTQAEALIKNFASLMTLEDYHVERSEVTPKEGVIDGREWSVSYYNQVEDGVEEILANTGKDKPEVGEKIIFLDTLGAIHGGKITRVESRDDETQDILIESLSSLEEYFDDYKIAGYVDWNLLDDINIEDSAQFENLNGQSQFGFVSKKDKAKKTTTKVTLKMEIKYSKEGKKNKPDVDFKEFTISGKNFIPFLVRAAGNVPLDILDINKAMKETGDSAPIGVGGSVQIDMELDDFELYTYADMGEVYCEYHYKPVIKISNLSGEVSFSTPSTTKIPLGMATVEFSMGLHAGVEDIDNLAFTLTNEAPIGAIFSVDSHGFSRQKIESKQIIDFGEEGPGAGNASFSVFAGAGPKCTVGLSGVPLVSPKLEVSGKCDAEQLDRVPGYERACWEATLAGPIVELDLNDNGDPSMATLALGLLGYPEFKFSFISEENANKKYLHIEFDDFAIIEDPNHDASVCTHEAKDDDPYSSKETGLYDRSYLVQEGDNYIYRMNDQNIIDQYNELYAVAFQYTLNPNSNVLENQSFNFGKDIRIDNLIHKNAKEKGYMNVGSIFEEDYGYDFNNLGYTYVDLDSDGTFELIFGVLGEPSRKYTPANYIFERAFALVDGKVVMFYNGGSRDQRWLGSDGYIYNYGSGGADNSGLSREHFELNFQDEDGTFRPDFVEEEYVGGCDVMTPVHLFGPFESYEARRDAANNPDNQISRDEEDSLQRDFEEKAVTIDWMRMSDYMDSHSLTGL